MEEWSTETKEMFCHTLELQQRSQAQLTDLEVRSCRNNIRIHRIPEEAEGDNTQDFLENVIKVEL